MKRFYSLLVSLVLLVCTGANVSPFIVECNAKSLPSGYIRLEYVQSTGSQYINTGVYPCQSTKIETKASIEETMFWGGIICAEDATNHVGIALNEYKDYFFVQYGYYKNTLDDYPFTKGVAYDLELDRNKFYVNHELVGTIANDISAFKCTRTLHLFRNNTPNVSGYSKIKLYFAKIYEDDVLIRDYVPCKNAEGVVGFYDFVGKEFNSSETSTAFVAGPESKLEENEYEIVKDITKYSERTYAEVFNLKDSSWYMLNSNEEYEKYGVVEVLPTNYKWETLTSEVANDSHKPTDFNSHIAFRLLRITPDNVNKTGHIYLRSTNTDQDSSYTNKEYYNIQTGSNGDFRLTRLYPGRYNYTKTFTYSVGSSSEFVKDGDSYLYTFDQNMYFNGVDGNDARISSVEVLVPNFDEVSTYEGKIVVMGDSLFRFQSGEWHSIGANKKGWVDYSHDFDINAKFSSVRIDLSQSIGFGMCWCIFTNGDEKYWMASPWDGAVRTLWDDQRFSISSFPKVDGTSATYQIDFSSYDSAPFHLASPAQYNYAFFTTQVYLVDYPATYPAKGVPEEIQNGTFVEPESEDNVDDKGLTGNGTESDPYLIGTATELKLFNELLCKQSTLHGRLVADIVLNENVLDANYDLNGDGSQFEQWESHSLDGGSFRGGGHTISGVYINNNEEYQGLFGGANQIDSLGVIDSYIKARRHAGGICIWLRNGNGKGGVISDCFFDGVVIATSDKAGGIAAHMGNGYEGGLQNKIINCYCKGKVMGYNHVGGICGSAYSLTSVNEDYISNCYSVAKVSASWTDCGAICGYADNAVGSKVSAMATHCYTTASVASAKSGQGYNGTIKTDLEFKCGIVRDLLNTNGGHFVQAIGKDDYPVLFKNVSEEESQGFLLIDGTEYNKTEDFYYSAVFYSRTFNNTKWQALFVPFSIPLDTLTKYGLEVAELNNIHMYDTDEDGSFDKTTLEFLYLKRSATEPNYPYLIKASATGEVTLTLKDVEVKATEETEIECSSTRKRFKIKGTYAGVSGSVMYNNHYYAMGGGTLVQMLSAEDNLKPQRWYMSIENKDGSPIEQYAPSLRIAIDGIELDDQETGIISIDNEQSTMENDDAATYNLMGQRVNRMVNGLYIKNHKKMIVR